MLLRHLAAHFKEIFLQLLQWSVTLNDVIVSQTLVEITTLPCQECSIEAKTTRSGQSEDLEMPLAEMTQSNPVSTPFLNPEEI